MHCAFWGVFVGLVVAYACKGLGLKDNEETIKRQNEVRAYLDSVDAPSEAAKKWRGVMKMFTPIWYFFAIGPACILGNTAFSFAGFPPLWSWQIFWWIVGIVMMWALCFKSELSTTNEVQMRARRKGNHDRGQGSLNQAGRKSLSGKENSNDETRRHVDDRNRGLLHPLHRQLRHGPVGLKSLMGDETAVH